MSTNSYHYARLDMLVLVFVHRCFSWIRLFNCFLLGSLHNIFWNQLDPSEGASYKHLHTKWLGVCSRRFIFSHQSIAGEEIGTIFCSGFQVLECVLQAKEREITSTGITVGSG